MNLTNRLLILSVLIFLIGMPSGRADQVATISEDCVIRTREGQIFTLAGITPTPETARFLKTFLPGRTVAFEADPALPTRSGSSVRPVYLFLVVQEMDLPINPGQKPREKRIMLNQELLRMGLAKVPEGATFREKTGFLSLQEEAKKTGQGIWSYHKPL